MDDYYALLHIPPDASPGTVRSAYRRLVKTCHPDLHGGDAALARQFIRITEAYSVLGDKEARARYDRERLAPAYAAAPASELRRPQPSYDEASLSKAEALYAAFARARNSFSGQEAEDIAGFLLIILRSPITYCVVISFLMLLMLKEVINGDGEKMPTHGPARTLQRHAYPYPEYPER